MRWPFRRPGPPLWTVRLHLFGPRLDLTDADSVAGGRTTRVVRARGTAEARRSAIAAAESNLAKILGRPVVEGLFWSVESVIEVPPDPEGPVNEFRFYERTDNRIAPVLLELGQQYT